MNIFHFLTSIIVSTWFFSYHSILLHGKTLKKKTLIGSCTSEKDFAFYQPNTDLFFPLPPNSLLKIVS